MDRTCTPTVVDANEVAIDEAREYRRREARSLKKESQSSLTDPVAGAEVDCMREPSWYGEAVAVICGRIAVVAGD